MPYHPMGEILQITADFLTEKWRNRNNCYMLCGDCDAWYQPEGRPEEGFCMRLKAAAQAGEEKRDV